MDAAPIRFGSWIGGDRDGNPFVTPEVTRQACLLSRWMAADLYVREIDALRVELSMTAGTAELRERAGGAREPYRAVLRTLRDRLAATRDGVGRGARQPGRRAVAAALAGPRRGNVSRPSKTSPSRCGCACARSRQTGNGVIAGGRLTDVLRRVAAFGLTLARLDIRQDADRHAEALDAITRALGLGAYVEWPEEQRQAVPARRARQPAAADPARLRRERRRCATCSTRSGCSPPFPVTRSART